MIIRRERAVALGRAMGWISVGLGAVELIGAKPIARWLGVPDHAGKIRAFGLRGLKAGWTILRSDVPTPGQMVSRVVGDVMELAALAGAARADGARSTPVVLSTLVVAGATAADVIAALGLKWGGPTTVEEPRVDVTDEARTNAERMADAFPMPTAVGIA